MAASISRRHSRSSCSALCSRRTLSRLNWAPITGGDTTTGSGSPPGASAVGDFSKPNRARAASSGASGSAGSSCGSSSGDHRGLGSARLPHLLDELRPLLPQDPLHAPDGVALAVQQVLDTPQQIDIVGPVVAAPTGALHRLDLGNRLSQNRSTCCGISRSSATSLMVRNASGALSTRACPMRAWARDPGGIEAYVELVLGVFRDVHAIDAQFQDGRGLEDHDTPRRNRHFLARFWIAPDPLALFADHEGPK